MRFPGLKSALATTLFALSLPLFCGTALGQQVTYYDFDAPQANPGQVSRQCSATAPSGVFFCFNDGTGANASPSFLSDTYPYIIDPVTTDPAGTVSSHYALQMTPAQPTQAASAWFAVPQKVSSGFTTYFAFKFTPDPNSFATADGIAFVLQNSAGGGFADGCPATGAGLSIVGGNGGCIGYGGIDNGLAIELDTYRNFWDPNDNGQSNNDNHVAIQNCGPGLSLSPDHQDLPCQVNLTVNGQQVPAIIDPGVTFADGNVHQVVIEYSGPTEATPYLLQVFIDPVFVPGTHTPVAGSIPALSGIYNIGANVNLMNSGTANDSAYVGFTSATGGGFEQHELMAWTYTPHTSVTVTQPLNPPGTPTQFNFGTHSLTVTYPSGGPSTSGINMVVTANTITPALFSTLVAGGPFTGSQCQVYDDTGGNCIDYSVSCVQVSSGNFTQCPPATPQNPIVIKSAYNNATAPISPGFIQGDPFYTQVTSITGNGSTATVQCPGECAVSAGEQVTVVGNSISGFDGTITVLSVDPVNSPNIFTYASTVTGTGAGGFLTSNNLQNAFVSYVPQRIDGTTTAHVHTYSDFITTSLTAAPTTLVISAPSASYGTAAPVTVTATSGNGTPTGNILLSVDGKKATSMPLVAGVASFSLTGLTATTHSLAVTYPQTGNFQGNTASGSIVITAVAPTVTFTGAPASAAYGTTFMVAATTNASTKPVITATGSCSIGSNKTVKITSGSGTCSLSATWAADTNYTAGSATQTTAATLAPTAIMVNTDTPNPANLQSPVTIAFSVTSTSGLVPGMYTVVSNVSGDPSCSTSLSPSGVGSCVLSFTTPGSRTLTITYAGNANFASTYTTVQQSVNSVALAGVTPAIVSLGNLYQGSTAGKTIVITNNGSVPMNITNPVVAVIGGNNQFIAQNLCPASLAVGQSCNFYVTFVAGSTAGPQNVNLLITDNAPNSPQTIPISATVGTAQLTLSPSPVAFGTVAVNSPNAIPVTLTNNGTSAVAISSIGLTGAPTGQFSELNNCPKSLAGGASCSITVNFNPNQAGAFSTYLTVFHNVGGNFAQVPVTGTAQ